MKTQALVIELNPEELAALRARAERERRLPSATAEEIIARTLRREIRQRRQPNEPASAREEATA